MLHVLVHGGGYHATTGNGKACLSFFLFEGNDRYNEQKKYKRDDKLSEQKKLLRFHILSYVHYVTTQTHEFKISDRIRKIERGIAEIMQKLAILLLIISMEWPFCYVS